VSDLLQGKRVVFLRSVEDDDRHIFSVLSEESFEIFEYSNPFDAQAQIYNEPPEIIVVSNRAAGWRDFIINIKADSFYNHLPILIIADEDDGELLSSLTNIHFDDFMMTPCRREELELRMKIRLLHTRRDLDANPLTRLPGNYSITTMIQKKIDSKEPFALGYIDLDNFKAYNDRYGFARGDDAIRMTSRVLVNATRRFAPQGGFIGHLGGDDFVAIFPPERIVEFCEETIQNFGIIGPTLFNDEDRLRGWYEYLNRQKAVTRFPLLTLSIAVINSNITKLNHPAKAAAIAAELKGVVKKLSGSNYMVDRRSDKSRKD
jgi:GGDEF domain-containing protein